MNPLTLTLRYTRSVGDLSPYFEGLASGLARATRCATCSKSWFPPRLTCPQAHGDLEWVTLPGSGVIRSLTRGETDPVLALVAMDGADNLTLGRVDADAAVKAGDRVQLFPDKMRSGSFFHLEKK